MERDFGMLKAKFLPRKICDIVRGKQRHKFGFFSVMCIGFFYLLEILTY